MGNPVVFYSRCKPQDFDAIDIALAWKRVFIGHPMPRMGALYDASNVKNCVVDPSCNDHDWAAASASCEKSRQYTQNRNLVRQIRPGSIVLVPRATRGVIYCGRITSNFELVNAPPWYNEYMKARDGKDDETLCRAAHIAQSWEVDDLRAIPRPIHIRHHSL
jgi:hypothetical protein